MVNEQGKREVAVGVLGGVGIEAIAMLVIVVSLTGMRLCMRLWMQGWRRLRLDEAFTIVGVLLYFVKAYITIMLSSQTFWLANDDMSDAHREALQTDDREYHLRVRGSKLFFYDWISYSAMIWTLKAAFCAYTVQRVVSPLQRLLYHIFGYASLAVSFVLVNLYLAVGCWPVSHMWQLNPDPGSKCYPANSAVLVWMYYGFNFATTLFLGVMAMPVFFGPDRSASKAVWRLLPLFAGALVAGLAVTRAIALRSGKPRSKEVAASWALWEGLVIIMMLNLPVICSCWKKMTNSEAGEQKAPANRPDGTELASMPAGARPGAHSSQSSGSSQIIVADEEESVDMPKKYKTTGPRRNSDPNTLDSQTTMTLEGYNTSSASRSNSLIHQTLEVTVSEEHCAQPGRDESCRSCGNYTRTWSRDEDAARPAQRSEYFADHIHTHTRWDRRQH
ncbi:hypothetical protein PT974_02941 [Cladobotryum mycophilum]|uniref:Uncharacterized protein n=1 Tax=Cladobotryum mycophilum TaxID=491253 RepID=A0ABR0SZN8_9HYPO